MSDASVVILTTGERPDDLARAVRSAHTQAGVDVEVVVVANGCDPEPPEGTDRFVHSVDNVGVAAGRNLGWREATADIVCFLDDDAVYADDAVVASAVARFADPTVGVLSFLIRDEHGTVVRRHVPRLVVGNSRRPSEVTTFLGGACALRRSVLDVTGGFPDGFVYAHEETDLAWAALDAGYRILYTPDLEVIHPTVPITRHRDALYYTARNRVLLARRRLPLLLAPVYVAVRAVLSLGLVRGAADLRALWRGYRDGLHVPAGERRPLSWPTVWKMTRLGRPPVI